MLEKKFEMELPAAADDIAAPLKSDLAPVVSDGQVRMTSLPSARIPNYCCINFLGLLVIEQ